MKELFKPVVELAVELGVDQWKPEDHQHVFSMLTAVQKRSHYRGLKVSKLEMLRSMIQMQSNWFVGRVLVTRDSRGRARSVLAGTALPYWWADQERGPMYATESIFVSSHIGAGEKLMRVFEAWAWTIPRVKKIELDISSDIHPDRTASMYERLGFRKTGSIFMKDRPNRKEVA